MHLSSLGQVCLSTCGSLCGVQRVSSTVCAEDISQQA
uniref:Uncharacterized protein n=1 Tax=Anguilla anguilla TaxID=7936 RepID=A0A0E9QTI5_ANGAN